MRKLTDEKQAAAGRRSSRAASGNGNLPDDGPSIEGAETPMMYPASLSWDQLIATIRQGFGESYFKNRSHEDLIEDFLIEVTSSEINTAKLRKLTEENAILLQRIDAMKKEITQLRQLNEAYGISIDRFIGDRSGSCMKVVSIGLTNADSHDIR